MNDVRQIAPSPDDHRAVGLDAAAGAFPKTATFGRRRWIFRIRMNAHLARMSSNGLPSRFVISRPMSFAMVGVT
jgi:hypothetical protein